jgi:hypothetical protein
MTPDISEFSYGFALTNELVGWMALSAVPIFPSLIEEGKASGGYDVKLDRPGVPLYIQFKRSNVMTRRSADEIKNHALPLNIPFHRFYITERNRSLQHASLMALDDGVNEVYYAAPRFHTLAGINSAWASKMVMQRSIFIRPSQIGPINDDLQHRVSFDDNVTYFCSEPKAIFASSIEEISRGITQKLKSDPRPVRIKLADWSQRLEQAVRKARFASDALDFSLPTAARSDSQSALPRQSIISTSTAYRELPRTSATEARSVRPDKALSPEQESLRRLSDAAQSEFNAQLIVVQPV